jgi:hypothetical protein
MGDSVPSPRVYQFGVFTLDARTGELTHNGSKTPLREQPLKLLLALLEQPGELVTPGPWWKPHDVTPRLARNRKRLPSWKTATSTAAHPWRL